jgi:hypothetical protein
VAGAGESLVFLLSLPRSGSTLLQRIVASHPDVATASEPWIVLPVVYSKRRSGVYAEYGHRAMVDAVDEFSAAFPAEHDEAVLARDHLLAAYDRARGDARLFLDKTPRYHLVVDEIRELFPAARFVFLWRQPLAVAASIVDTFGDGRWNLDKYAVDVFDGPRNLLRACRRDDPRCHSLRYEDLVVDPQHETARIWRFLGVDENAVSAHEFDRVTLRGRMGDRAAYRAIASEPLEKWRQTMGTPIRRRWCRSYLSWLGRGRVTAMGYDYDALSDAVQRLDRRLRSTASDAGRIVAGYGYWRVANRLIARADRPLGLPLMARRARS